MIQFKPTAFVPIPNWNTPAAGPFNNLNGYWNPPDCVVEQWSGNCRIDFISDKDYEEKKKIILKSYNECMNDFYTLNAL